MSRLQLRRFALRILHDRATGDTTQVPAAGATLAVHRQGATVREAIELTEQSQVRVQVFGTGRIGAGDTLKPWLDPAEELLVTAVDAGGTWVEVAYSGYRVLLQPGERLIPFEPYPTLYSEASGTSPLSGSTVILDTDGRASFYCPEARFDCVLSGSGLTARLIQDCEGGWSRGGSAWLNAKDFPSIQAAIDALPDAGGTIFIPAGTHFLTETLYTPCDRPCHLLGEGAAESLAGGAVPGTVLQWTTNVGMLRLRGDNSSVRQLVLQNISNGDALAEDEGYGIAIGRRAVEDAHPHPGSTRTGTEYERANRTPARGYVIEDVFVSGAPGWGLYIPGFGLTSDETTAEADAVEASPTEGGTLSFWVDLIRVRISESRRYGLCFVGSGCTTTYFTNCAFLRAGAGQVPTVADRYYVYVARAIQIIFGRCTFEGLDPEAKPWIRMRESQCVAFSGCWFEQDPIPEGTGDPTYFLNFAVRCIGGVIENCHFTRGTGAGGKLSLIQLEPLGALGLSIQNLSAVSADESRSEDGYVEPKHVDLGGHTNEDLRVVGSGSYTDVKLMTFFPIQYYDAPSRGFMSGPALSKLPGITDQEVARMVRGINSHSVVNGNMLMQWDLAEDTSGLGAGLYYWGGTLAGWRLFNNAPSLTTSQRDARVGMQWVQGDIIYNLDVDALEVRVGTGWRRVLLEPASREDD